MWILMYDKPENRDDFQLFFHWSYISRSLCCRKLLMLYRLSVILFYDLSIMLYVVLTGLKKGFRLLTYQRWFLGRVLWFLSMWKVGPKYILMHSMLSLAGSRRHCHQLKSLQQRNGNLEGKLGCPYVNSLVEDQILWPRAQLYATMPSI